MFAMPTSRYIFGTLPWYSVLMVTGICAACLLASREEKRLALPRDTVIDLALWLIPSGVVGARLYYVFFAWETFAPNPISILYIWRGGLAIYGAIIGGALAALIFSRRRKLPLLLLTDVVMPGLALAQAIGRWGNYFNMEAYGLTVTNPAWKFFPFAVLIPENGEHVWHMATFFYESIWNLVVFTTLMLLRKRVKKIGDVTLWYALLYGGGRLIVEGLRLDSLMTVGGAGRVSQLLSIALCLLALFFFGWRAMRSMNKAHFITGIAALVIALIIAWILPKPEQAFAGYHIVWIIQTVCTAAMLTILTLQRTPGMRHLLILILAWTALALNWAIPAYLATISASGPENAVLLCILFSLNAITGAAAAYQRIPAVTTAKRSSIL